MNQFANERTKERTINPLTKKFFFFYIPSNFIWPLRFRRARTFSGGKSDRRHPRRGRFLVAIVIASLGFFCRAQGAPELREEHGFQVGAVTSHLVRQLPHHPLQDRSFERVREHFFDFRVGAEDHVDQAEHEQARASLFAGPGVHGENVEPGAKYVDRWARSLLPMLLQSLPMRLSRRKIGKG